MTEHGSPAPGSISVLLVDDHAIWRGGVRSMLDDTEFEVIGEASSGKEALEKVRELSFREELHAIDAVIGGQGVAICSDVIVSNELRNGLLVKAHPLSLPGYGYYLVSMPHSPQAPVIEAFSAWMRAIS